VASVLPGHGRGTDSGGDATPASVPGTPQLGRSSSLALQKESLSGRASRQSDEGSERQSLAAGTTLYQVTHSQAGTDHVIEK